MATHEVPRYTTARCPQCGAELPEMGEQVTCRYCGSNLIRTGPGPGGQPGAVVRGVRLRMFTYTDTQGLGVEAFRFLMPVGWEFRGGVQWRMDCPSMPATIAFQVWNPQGAEALEVFPTQSFTHSNNLMTAMLKPTGSQYFGVEVRPLVPLQQAFREIILPRFRGQMPGLRLTKEELLPDLPKQVGVQPPGPGEQRTAEGAKVRLEYELGGVALEEEIYGVLEATRIAIPGMWMASEMVFWQLSYLFSCRAHAGRLDSCGELFLAMLRSFQLSSQFKAGVAQVTQNLTQGQIRHIHQIGQFSRDYSRMSNQMMDDQMRGWEARQAVYDRLSTDWSQTIRGVDEYYDPNKGYGVELPGGYGHAWANALGEYIVTDDPNFNPNIGSNQNWEEMGRR